MIADARNAMEGLPGRASPVLGDDLRLDRQRAGPELHPRPRPGARRDGTRHPARRERRRVRVGLRPPRLLTVPLLGCLSDATGRRTDDDERGRWPVCSLAGLSDAAERSPLTSTRVWRVRIATVFASVGELWNAFLLGVGPSGATAIALPAAERQRVRSHLEAEVPTAPDRSVHLSATPLAVAGTAVRV